MLHARLRTEGTEAHLQPVLAALGCHGKHCPQKPKVHALCCPWPGRCADDPSSRAASVQATPLAIEWPARCMQVEETVPFGERCVRLRSVPRHHRNTLLHTGLMLWDSGPVLARLLLACPALTAGQGPLPKFLCAYMAAASTRAAAICTRAACSLISTFAMVQLRLLVPARHAWHPDSCT